MVGGAGGCACKYGWMRGVSGQCVTTLTNSCLTGGKPCARAIATKSVNQGLSSRASRPAASPVHSVHVCPSGDVVYASREDGQVHVWDMRCLPPVPARTLDVWSMAAMNEPWPVAAATPTAASAIPQRATTADSILGDGFVQSSSLAQLLSQNQSLGAQNTPPPVVYDRTMVSSVLDPHDPSLLAFQLADTTIGYLELGGRSRSRLFMPTVEFADVDQFTYRPTRAALCSAASMSAPLFLYGSLSTKLNISELTVGRALGSGSGGGGADASASASGPGCGVTSIDVGARVMSCAAHPALPAVVVGTADNTLQLLYRPAPEKALHEQHNDDSPAAAGATATEPQAILGEWDAWRS